MADTTAPHTSVTAQDSPEITEAFIEDRQSFWHSFTNFVTGGAVAVAVLLIAMWLFLV